jgi:hypothetical protein
MSANEYFVQQQGKPLMKFYVPGTYKITYVKPGGRIILESQLRLFAIERDVMADDWRLFFSARPRSGTQEFMLKQLRTIERVPFDAYMYINWDPRKPGKPESWPHKR